jgi:hypothetical protein
MAITYDEALDNALDNSDFETTGSVAKAKAFLVACNQLDLLLPDSASDQGSAQSFSSATRDRLRQRAQAYIAANASGARTRFLSVNTGGFR